MSVNCNSELLLLYNTLKTAAISRTKSWYFFGILFKEIDADSLSGQNIFMFCRPCIFI